MIPPTSIDATDITGATIDGTDVTEITVDGQTVFTAGPPAPASAIHHWVMDEGTGTTVRDFIGGLDGNANFSDWISDSDFIGGTALDFSGSDQIDIANSRIDLQKGAILATAKNVGTGFNTLLCRRNNFYGEESIGSYSIGFNSNICDCELVDGNVQDNIEFNTNPSQVQRYGFVWSVPDDILRLSINGTVVVDKNLDLSSVNNPNRDILIGQREQGSTGFVGQIDNIILCNDVLTASELQTDFNAQPFAP